MIDRKKAELDSRRPLTEGEAERLTEEFVVEYTYKTIDTIYLFPQKWGSTA